MWNEVQVKCSTENINEIILCLFKDIFIILLNSIEGSLISRLSPYSWYGI